MAGGREPGQGCHRQLMRVEWGSTGHPLRQVLRGAGWHWWGEEGQKLQIRSPSRARWPVTTGWKSRWFLPLKDEVPVGSPRDTPGWARTGYCESEWQTERCNRRTCKSQWVIRAWCVCYGYLIVANNEEKTETLGRKSKYCVLHVELGTWGMAVPSRWPRLPGKW